MLISEVSKTSPEAPATRPASVAPARRASSSSGGEDPDEKRQKFLERNRYVYCQGYKGSSVTCAWQSNRIHEAAGLWIGQPIIIMQFAVLIFV